MCKQRNLGDMCFFKRLKCGCARIGVYIGIIAFISVAIVAALLPLNSIAYAKNSYNAAKGLHIANVSVMTKQKTVRTQGEYMFTKRSASLLITFDGLDASEIRNAHKATVSVGRYQIVSAKADLAKIEAVSSLVNIRYKIRPRVLGIVRVELQKEGIYDLQDISIRLAAVTMHPKRIWGGVDSNPHVSKQTNYISNENRLSGNKLCSRKPILSIPDSVLNASDLTKDNSYSKRSRYIVIDKIAPRLSVSYDNNASYEGKYFRNNRASRILIQDDSFVFSYLLHDSYPIAKVFADGKQVMVLTAKSFKNDGVHTNMWYADVSFSGDASWDVRYCVEDLSGNVSSSISNKFIIDTLAPTVSITGVQQGGAYSHAVVPTLVIKDRWLKPESVTYSLRRMRYAKELHSFVPKKADSQSVSVQYAGFYNGTQDDDVYQLQWSAKDLVDHVISGKLQFSINRSGSSFSIDSSTKAMNRKQLQNAKDIHIEELNPSGLASPAKISVMQDGVEKILSKQDFSVNSRTDHGWQRLTYTIFKRNFADNAHYRVRVMSVDKAGNHSCSENAVSKKEGMLQFAPASVQFTVDNLAPIATVFDMQNNSTYHTNKEGKTLRISAKDNIALQYVTIDVDGKTNHIWNGKDVNKSVLSTKLKPDVFTHDVLVKAADYAGNITALQYKNVKIVSIANKLVKKSEADKKSKNSESKDTDSSDDGSDDGSDNSSDNDDWIARSQVKKSEKSFENADSFKRNSVNYIGIVAYICAGIIAILCAVLGISIIFKKKINVSKLF